MTWPTAPLGELVDFYSGGTPAKSNSAFWSGEVPWFSARDIKRHRLTDSVKHVSEDVFTSSPLRKLPAGTIVMVVRGMILVHTIPIAILDVDAAINQDLKALIPKGAVDPSFLSAMLRAQHADILTRVSTAAHGTKKLDSRVLENIDIPVPPIEEQRRIAAILDGAQRLAAQRRRQLDLHGSLPQSLLLSMFGEPISPASGRRMVAVGEAGRVQLGRQRSPQYQTGNFTTPYIRVANVFENRIDLSDLLAMDFDDRDRLAYSLQRGDILLNEGQSTELVGRPAMWRGQLPLCCFQNTLVRFQPDPEKILPEFALAVMIRYFQTGQFARVSSKTSNVAHLGASRFSAMPFPVPPIERQREYATRVSALLDHETAIQEAVDKSGDLFVSLQARAFAGEL